MRYHPPGTVISPRDLIEDVTVIYDGGTNPGFSVAEITWDGATYLAMRWNIAEREWNDPQKQSLQKVCVGMPSSRGYPVWFIIPDGLFDANSPVRKEIEKYNKKKK